jgi:dehydrogenase/reductase SDR family member 7B
MKPHNELTNRVVVITGAGSGIGKALAAEGARQGANLALADINEQSLEETRNMMQLPGDRCLTVKTDVSKEEDCKELIQKTVDHFGKIDVLINNAGISMRALFRDVDLKVIEKVMAINFYGAVYCSKYAMPYLLQSKGSLVGISSVAGYKGLPGRTGYSASKFALQGFLEVIRIENLKTGLHVLIACPGFTASNIRKTALSGDGSKQGESPRDEDKLMPAEEVARHIYQGIKQRKDRITLTSQGKLTVLLNKFFPKFMDKMVYNHMAKEPDSPFK